jgi:spoIIIJ-associated protein
MTTEFTGRDLAEAIAAAAAALDLPQEKLKFDVLDMGSGGFLGLGRRRARIAVDPADPTLDLLDDDDSPAPAAEAPVPEAGAAPEAETAPEPLARPATATAAPGPVPREPVPLTRPAAGETQEDNPQDETALLARKVVGDILSRLGLDADLSLIRLGSRLVVNIDGPDRALLIGARGATLEALGLLVSKIMARKKPGEPVILDVADYRFRRHSQVLENFKLQAAAARRTGQPQSLTGLGAAEKRLVRLALRPFKDIELKPGRGREDLLLVPTAAPSGNRRRKKQKGAPR